VVSVIILRKRFASGVAHRHAVAKKGYGPGNHPHYSGKPEKAAFYAVYAPSSLYDSIRIDCHKLSDRLSVVQQGEELYGDREARRKADVLLVPQVDNSCML
jgi:hypothetical protein